MKISRTAWLRNMEIGRRYGTRASQSVRNAATNLSNRVSKRTSEMRAGGTTSAIQQRASNATKRVGESVDRGLNYTQKRLEDSDTAVIAFTLTLLIACVVLGALIWWAWNRF